MTDLSQRIMDAWLAVNPEPDKWETDQPYEIKMQWLAKKQKLHTMLVHGAYESAVIQFLVPKGFWIDRWLSPQEDGWAVHTLHLRSYLGSTFAEALLNAVLAARVTANG